MGGWKLEVFRMCLYMSFPVGMFHYFNQPENYEDWVIKVKQKYYPKESEKMRQLLKETMDEHNREIERKRLKAMERTLESEIL